MPLPDNNAKRFVYLDHAATTPVQKEVLDAMLPFFVCVAGNPSALYGSGVAAEAAVSEARTEIAALLGAQSDTIHFTSGGTESCNLAILGTAEAYEHAQKRTGHMITTAGEHMAVLRAMEKLEARGWTITRLSLDASGRIDLQEFKKELREDTVLVSIMTANNEIGTIYPIADIGRAILQQRKKQNTVYPYFHTDACQAAGAMELKVEKLHTDLLTMNASKLHGPKGVGVLYIRRETQIAPQQLGGGQEFGMRSGTENVPAIVGCAKAFSLAQEDFVATQQRIKKLRNLLAEKLQQAIPELEINGPALSDEDRLANNLHVTIPGLDQEALLLYLDAYGISIGIGSACHARGDETSHVMDALGKSGNGHLRLTLGKDTSEEDVRYTAMVLPKVVKTLQALPK